MRVIITAGAAGIGLAMARSFAHVGHQVWIADTNAAALATLPEFQHSVVDIADEQQTGDWIAQIHAQWGSIDVVCANAGIAGPTAAIEDISVDDWRDTLAVNLEGAFLLTKHVAPILKQQKSGALIYTSSTAGQFGYPNRAPYCAAKWAINGLMKTAAMELGVYGIRANSICPGGVHGDRFLGVMQREAAQKNMTFDQVYQGYISGTSLKTLINAKDIGALAVYLASAPSVSGQIIAIDGHTENPDPKPVINER